MGEVNADIAAGDDERDGEDNQGDAADDADRERFAEDQDAETNGCDGLEGSEDGGRGGPDEPDGARGAEEWNGGGEDGERQEVAPQVPSSGQEERTAEIDAEEKEHQSEKQDVESDGERGNVLEPGLPDGDDVDGIGKRRDEDERSTGETEGGTVAGPVKQPDATHGEQNAQGGGPR